MIIHAGVTLSLKDTLEIGGAIDCQGIIEASSGTITLNGSSAQSLETTIFNYKVLFGLNLNNAAGLTLQDTLHLTGNLGLMNGTLHTNDFLMLSSTDTSTAWIAPVGNGSLNGDIWVERFIPARRAFRFLSSPVTTTNGLDDNWQQQIFITGLGGASNGFDTSISNNPSMFTLNESAQTWNAITNTTNTNLVQGTGYRLMVRGNRSVDMNNQQAPATSVVLVARGTHQVGNKTYHTSSTPALSGTIGHYSFMGNPYPSSIDWNAISKTNISATYYTWNAHIGSNGRGAYVNFNSLGNVSSDGNINQYIGSGSAFMVKTTGINPSMTIEEQDKVGYTQGSQILGKQSVDGLRIQLLEDDTQVVDAMYIYRNDLAKDVLDEYDSDKWLNPVANIYSFTYDGGKVSIQGFKELYEGKEISLGIENLEIKNYTMVLKEWENPIWQLYLYDHFIQQEFKIDTFYKYAFSINNQTLSAANNRFKLLFKRKTTGFLNQEACGSFSLYPVPANHSISLLLTGPERDIYEYQILNQYGQLLGQGNIDYKLDNPHHIAIENLYPGIYILKISNSYTIQTFKFIKE